MDYSHYKFLDIYLSISVHFVHILDIMHADFNTNHFLYFG